LGEFRLWDLAAIPCGGIAEKADACCRSRPFDRECLMQSAVT
jgi:hypothetical protein